MSDGRSLGPNGERQLVATIPLDDADFIVYKNNDFERNYTVGGDKSLGSIDFNLCDGSGSTVALGNKGLMVEMLFA